VSAANILMDVLLDGIVSEQSVPDMEMQLPAIVQDKMADTSKRSDYPRPLMTGLRRSIFAVGEVEEALAHADTPRA
jgi:hypothetical protein